MLIYSTLSATSWPRRADPCPGTRDGVHAEKSAARLWHSEADSVHNSLFQMRVLHVNSALWPILCRTFSQGPLRDAPFHGRLCSICVPPGTDTWRRAALLFCSGLFGPSIGAGAGAGQVFPKAGPLSRSIKERRPTVFCPEHGKDALPTTAMKWVIYIKKDHHRVL